MKNLLSVLLAFGLGVYVGRPTQITPQRDASEEVVALHQPPLKLTEPVDKPTPKPSEEPPKTPTEIVQAAEESEAFEKYTPPDVPNPPESVEELPELDVKASALAIAQRSQIGTETYAALTSEEYAHMEELRIELLSMGILILRSGDERLFGGGTRAFIMVQRYESNDQPSN